MIERKCILLLLFILFCLKCFVKTHVPNRLVFKLIMINYPLFRFRISTNSTANDEFCWKWFPFWIKCWRGEYDKIFSLVFLLFNQNGKKGIFTKNNSQCFIIVNTNKNIKNSIVVSIILFCLLNRTPLCVGSFFLCESELLWNGIEFRKKSRSIHTSK